MSVQSFWLALAIAAIPAFASIGAAIIAARAARDARRSDAEAQRARDLEARNSERKYEIYEPMINMLRDVLTAGGNVGIDEGEVRTKMADFATWISIYGSDDAVEAFHNIMQAAYTSAPARCSFDFTEISS
jgi:hypothetical protein